MAALAFFCSLGWCARTSAENVAEPVSTPVSLPAGVERIRVEDGLVTLRAREVPLRETLEVLARESGLAFRSYGPIAGHVNADFNAVPLNRVLGELVPNHSIIYRRERGGNIVPTAFAVLKSGTGADSPPASSRRLAYGTGKGQLGRFQRPEMETRGPESFAVDGDGRIFACDTVNSRIAVIPSGDGRVTFFNTPSPPVDIALGDNLVYILGRDGSLLQYSPDGRALGGYQVPGFLFKNRRDLAAGAAGPVLRTIEGEAFLLSPEASPQRLEAEPRAVKEGTGTARVLLPQSGATVEVELTLPGLLSIGVLGRDPEGDLLLQVEELPPSGHGVALRVLKLSPDGQVLASLENIPNNYDSWTARLLAVSPEGEVGQLLPGREAVDLNWWNWSVPEQEQPVR